MVIVTNQEYTVSYMIKYTFCVIRPYNNIIRHIHHALTEFRVFCSYNILDNKVPTSVFRMQILFECSITSIKVKKKYKFTISITSG